MALILSKSRIIPDTELTEDFFCSSGPGGQNVNKVSTAVRLNFDLAASRVFSVEEKLLLGKRLAPYITEHGVMQVTSQEYRTQLANRREAARKLADLLCNALIVPAKRRPTRPTRGSVERRIASKKKHAAHKAARRFRPELGNG